ncbi:MAG TPA: SET domain-containing protein-lysine N-methyltransferase [Candidatus Paceibacterota bacterium]|nr:SET domain-containing protein-lysine N-methyltransferase [Verrucomicrobiota bacterium]HSA11984.1 SET domain-containing protein-lysine N-methyltransferase [Candidatus Paceibacterota bacterium]
MTPDETTLVPPACASGDADPEQGRWDACPTVAFGPSPIHGLGGFAKAAIGKGARILEYVGERISKSESLRRCEQDNGYIFSLNSEQDLDGDVAWNPARLFNHSCTPNCEAQMEDERIWIVAKRDIAPGEEITFNYNYDLVDYQDHPCRCGSPMCVGYMVAEEFFEHVLSRKAGRH